MRAFILIFFIVALSSCNQDDNNDPVLPGDFEISIHSLTPFSTFIKWTESVASDGSAVVYSIYLNDILVQERVALYEYSIENLVPETDYQVKVVAENESGSIEKTLQFRTPAIDENLFPGDFEISLHELTPISALIKWTESTSGDGDIVLYSLFLNDHLLEENMEQLEYSLEGLLPATYYEVKVEAENRFGTNQQILHFTTPPISGYYLYKMTDGRYINHYFEYDENNNLVMHTIGDSPGGQFFYEYEYENNQIVYERSYGYGYFSGRCNYLYDANGLAEISYRRGDDIVRTDTYFFNPDQTFYSREFTQFNNNNGESFTVNYSCTASYNVQNNLTELITRNETAGGNIRIIQFQYHDGNLVQITDADNNVWDIDYDDKHILKTFNSHFEGTQFSFGLKGNNYLEDSLVEELMAIPFFYRFNNKNNVTQVRKNGILFSEIGYQYNTMDYPIQAIFNGSSLYSFEYTPR